MRMNLDPLEQYKDEAVWSALEQVTHTDPLFDKRYCPVNNSSRPEEEMWKVPPDGPYWERFDRLGLSNDPLRPYFLPNDLLGGKGFNLREYFSLDDDPSGEVTPHTISNATEKLRTLSATSNRLYNLSRLIWKPLSPASLAVCTSRWDIVILSLFSLNSFTIFLGQ